MNNTRILFGSCIVYILLLLGAIVRIHHMSDQIDSLKRDLAIQTNKINMLPHTWNCDAYNHRMNYYDNNPTRYVSDDYINSIIEFHESQWQSTIGAVMSTIGAVDDRSINVDE